MSSSGDRMHRVHHRARRRWLGLAAVAAALGPVAWSGNGLGATAPAAGASLTRRIPSTGEAMPVIGLGSWITFNVGNDGAARDACTDVVRAYFADGGRMIDSSPMCGSSQATIGHALAQIGRPAALFEMKAAGRLRYVGITTSEGRRHAEIEHVMRTQPIDFVQITYNLLDREVEQRILPLSQERSIAVIANRPFREGALLRQLARHRLPAWAADVDCETWAQVALKFVVTHPGVTCAIPATSQLAHVRQNMAAARGRMPDAALRERMAREVAAV